MATFRSTSSASLLLVKRGRICQSIARKLPTHPPDTLVGRVYFIFVTISTLGYGDFAPRTLLGRTFLMLVILAGVLFFSNETAELLHLQSLQNSGRGRFRPRRGVPYVVVAGGAVASGGATIADFLQEACHPARAEAEPQGVPQACPIRSEPGA